MSNYFDKFETREDLMEAMQQTKSGLPIYGVPKVADFKSQQDFFQKHLKKTFPGKTNGEILEIVDYISEIQEVRSWFNFHLYRTIMEYDTYKSRQL